MDKNPKHPLKKKKVHQKMNVADHSVEEQAAFGKHKKHTYEYMILIPWRLYDCRGIFI